MAPALRLGEFVATLALAQDNAFGQPLESQLRSCLPATWLCDEAGYAKGLRETVYWVALLRYIGCTGHAHEVATLFGDEIAIRARTLVHDAANPAEVMEDVVAFATAGRPPEQREQIVRMIEQGAHEWAVHNFASGCEVGDMLVQRLGFSPDVREALRFTFDRWNGNGFPTHARGEAIPLAMRIVHLTHDMEAIGRLFSPARALEAARERRDRTYDPALADRFVAHGADWFDRLARLDPRDAVLALEPEPRRTLDGAELDDALTVAADFIDLKSPYMAGHSRRCAALGADAARLVGLADETAVTLRRGALVHDFGTTGVPNSIWDKPGALTRAEFDRADRPAFSAIDAATELRRLASEGVLERRASNAVLVAAGHGEPNAATAHRVSHPGGLSRREVEVPRLAAMGLTTRQIADRLCISPKTADHHIQHVYGKIGVSTRAAAALWAIQQDVVQ